MWGRLLPSLLRQGGSSSSRALLSTRTKIPGIPDGAERTTGVAPPSSSSCSDRAPDFLSWLPSRIPRVLTPLTDPLPSFQPPLPASPPSTRPITEITTLPNGARIISEEAPGPVCSLGMYIDSGSMYEKESETGSSILLECFAFKSSQNRDKLSMMKELEQLGGIHVAYATREHMTYTVDCLKTSFPIAMELLCDSVLNPSFDAQDLEEQKMRLAMLMSMDDVQLTLLSEKLVGSVFKGSIGKPLYPGPDAFKHITPEVLHNFVRKNYAAPRLILAASGIEHSKLVELARPMLEQASSTPAPPEPPAQYVAGCVHVPAPASCQDANLMLAFETKGGWHDVKGAVIMTVLMQLMGGGSSFSSGGPGKGMHSRLYTRVLNQYYWVHSCAAFQNCFNSQGLLGINASCEPRHARDMLDVMCREMETVTRSLSGVEVDRAKRGVVSVIHNALESKNASAEDIGRQFLTYGFRISGEEYVNMIEAVTVADLKNYMERVLSSTPSLALMGPGTEDIKYDDLLARYGSRAAEMRGTVERIKEEAAKLLRR